MKDIPSSALLLGWAGVIPFATLATLLCAGSDQSPGFDQVRLIEALITYAMIILSFMGGVQWGLEMARSGGASATGLAVSVVPALVAFAASFVNVLAALLILAAGFLILLVYDFARVRVGIGPTWYATLRIQLSAAVVLCLGAAVVDHLGAAA